MASRRVSRADLDFLNMSAENSRNSHSDQEMERLALSAAEAIRSLIAERRLLRQEVTHLRRQMSLIREGYKKLADDLIGQLRLVEGLDQGKTGSDSIIEFPPFLEKGTQDSR